jgi:hypothetical protein
MTFCYSLMFHTGYVEIMNSNIFAMSDTFISTNISIIAISFSFIIMLIIPSFSCLLFSYSTGSVLVLTY